MEPVYGFREAAALMGMSESTLRKKAAAGLVSHFMQFGRTKFHEADLLAVRQMRPVRVTGLGRVPRGTAR
jgi:hypothetical protein